MVEPVYRNKTFERCVCDYIGVLHCYLYRKKEIIHFKCISSEVRGLHFSQNKFQYQGNSSSLSYTNLQPQSYQRYQAPVPLISYRNMIAS